MGARWPGNKRSSHRLAIRANRVSRDLGIFFARKFIHMNQCLIHGVIVGRYSRTKNRAIYERIDFNLRPGGSQILSQPSVLVRWRDHRPDPSVDVDVQVGGFPFIDHDRNRQSSRTAEIIAITEIHAVLTDRNECQERAVSAEIDQNVFPRVTLELELSGRIGVSHRVGASPHWAKGPDGDRTGEYPNGQIGNRGGGLARHNRGGLPRRAGRSRD